MKSRGPFIAIALLAFFPAAAQVDTIHTAPSYYFAVHSGVLIGQEGAGVSPSVSLIQGLRYQRFRLGVGIGYDGYRDWRTLPLFVSGGYDVVAGRKWALYLEMNTGYATAWRPLVAEDQIEYSDGGGFLHHPVVGCRVSSGKLKLYLSVGYKFQSLTYAQEPRWWMWGWPSTGTRTTVDREMQRLSVQLGFGWQ